MLIRKATEQDIPAITQLFTETIEAVNSRDYNAEQVKVWSEGHTYTERWIKSLSAQYFIVAVNDEIITGMGSITPEGYLDLLYVHKDYQGRGVASALVDELLARASLNNLSIVTSGVSITAKPFFEKKGFTIVTTQRKMVGDIEILNYKMTIQIV
ncbi:MAG: GNAT family N-acetyltransferase [Sphingobacteriales bacterium]|nr:GNAT family N-acetyltransferase [Sphingobacteriales bacterium]